MSDSRIPSSVLLFMVRDISHSVLGLHNIELKGKLKVESIDGEYEDFVANDDTINNINVVVETIVETEENIPYYWSTSCSWLSQCLTLSLWWRRRNCQNLPEKNFSSKPRVKLTTSMTTTNARCNLTQ